VHVPQRGVDFEMLLKETFDGRCRTLENESIILLMAGAERLKMYQLYYRLTAAALNWVFALMAYDGEKFWPVS
jgi:hypothetical protein